MSAEKFLLLLCFVSSIQLIYADVKCNAICFLGADKMLMCKRREDLDIEVLRSMPVKCQKNEYPSSIEIIIGNFEKIEGIAKNGLDAFRDSESPKSYTNKLQLTIKMKIKMVDAGLFDKLNNLERLELHPYRVNKCAFFTLPKSVKDVLLQCSSTSLQMMDEMFWPLDSQVKFKINMCLQRTSCFACRPSKTTPFRYALLTSERKGPLALNKVVSLKHCMARTCSSEASVCLPKVTKVTTALPPTTTTTKRTTTTKSTTKAKTTTTAMKKVVKTVKQEEAPPSLRSQPDKDQNRKKYVPEISVQPVITKKHFHPSRPYEKEAESQDRKMRGNDSPKMSNFFMMVLIGATGINTIILLILVGLIARAIGCCGKKQRGIYMMPKGNYPPEYSTLRPV